MSTYIALKTGSYGAAPIPVMKKMHELLDKNAAAPDRWMRDEKLGYIKSLRDLRARLGVFVGCDTEDIVMWVHIHLVPTAVD